MHRARSRNAGQHDQADVDARPLFAGNPISIPSLGGITRVRYTLDNDEREAVGRCMTPPTVFCLDENPAGVLAFIDDFRAGRLLGLRYRLDRRAERRYKRQWIGTYTDIAAIRRITPAAALVLAAEYDRAHRRRRLGRRGVVNAADWDPGVARMLIDVGFLEHLQSSLPNYQPLSPRPTEKRMLLMLTGDQNEPEEINTLSEKLQSLMNSVIDSALTHAIYTGLIEAMDNCATHAYPKSHRFHLPTERGRWWMSGSVAGGRELEVIFFDQGATIPGTLPHSGMRENAHVWIQRTLHLVGIEAANDGQRIQAAMAVGRSAYEVQGTWPRPSPNEEPGRTGRVRIAPDLVKKGPVSI